MTIASSCGVCVDRIGGLCKTGGLSGASVISTVMTCSTVLVLELLFTGFQLSQLQGNGIHVARRASFIIQFLHRYYSGVFIYSELPRRRGEYEAVSHVTDSSQVLVSSGEGECGC